MYGVDCGELTAGAKNSREDSGGSHPRREIPFEGKGRRSYASAPSPTDAMAAELGTQSGPNGPQSFPKSDLVDRGRKTMREEVKEAGARGTGRERREEGKAARGCGDFGRGPGVGGDGKGRGGGG